MGAQTITLPTSHVAMLAKPKEVADFIIRAAAVGGTGKTLTQVVAFAMAEWQQMVSRAG